MSLTSNENLMEKIVSLCKRRGFVYPSSEIYGGFANSWDFGPLGAELKLNIKNLWWKKFVHQRDNIFGIDASIIMNPKVWQASGHVSGFTDPLIDCKECKARIRADHLAEGYNIELSKIKNTKKLSEALKKANAKCPLCGSENLTEVRNFNLLFKTFVGPVEDESSTAYLRGETAQAMFVDFKNILNSFHPKLPFGIAQIGKAFRNEITPGNFIFRTREFEQMEIEYFIKKEEWEKHFEYWKDQMLSWIDEIGIKRENIYLHEIPAEERAHYSQRTIDIEYKFPFGQKELYGLAYRGDYDLKNHQEYSKEDLTYFDQETNSRFLPHVIEPTFGVERTILALLVEAYTEEKLEKETRVVLKFNKKIAPFKVAVLPLVRNKEEIVNKSKEVFNLIKENFVSMYDETGSIGKRYRRQDEIGTPFCITIDFETLNDNSVTIRDRDSMKQERVRIEELNDFLNEKLNN